MFASLIANVVQHSKFKIHRFELKRSTLYACDGLEYDKGYALYNRSACRFYSSGRGIDGVCVHFKIDLARIETIEMDNREAGRANSKSFPFRVLVVGIRGILIVMLQEGAGNCDYVFLLTLRERSSFCGTSRFLSR